MNSTWRALSREAALAAEHMAIGASAIDKASYGREGVYSQMFFALSVGFERAAKLALVVDFALETAGNYPDHNTLRAFGHNLRELLEAVDTIAQRRGLDSAERLPRSPVHNGIVQVLSDFATNITRYYNLDLVTGDPKAATRTDPIQAWFELVTTPVLQAHYTARERALDSQRAAFSEALLGPVTMVRFTSEDGEAINDIGAAALHGAALERSKPFTRMYVMQIARFLAKLLGELGYAGYAVESASIPHLSEFFAIFNNPDSYLRGRKTWSIYRL
jgi:hypothetical protein